MRSEGRISLNHSVQMLGGIEVEDCIGIARQTVTTGMHEVMVQREVSVSSVQHGKQTQLASQCRSLPSMSPRGCRRPPALS